MLSLRSSLLCIAFFALYVHAAYDPSTAMSSLHFCKASYCAHDSIAAWNCGSSCSYHGNFQVKGVYTNGTFDAQGYTGYSPSQGAIIVAFRGSANIPNWIADFDFKKMPYPDPACSGCEVHTGFFQVYLEMAAQLLPDVQALVRAHPSTRIIVTGHSLGAAITVHAAVDIMRKISGLSSLEVYNFGEPRVGNPAFAAWVTTVLPAGVQYRVTHSADPVPHLPPKDFGFLHVPHELWYNNNGDSVYASCNDSPTAEDPHCSDSTIPVGIADHTLYLGVCTGCDC